MTVRLNQDCLSVSQVYCFAKSSKLYTYLTKCTPILPTSTGHTFRDHSALSSYLHCVPYLHLHTLSLDPEACLIHFPPALLLLTELVLHCIYMSEQSVP